MKKILLTVAFFIVIVIPSRTLAATFSTKLIASSTQYWTIPDSAQTGLHFGSSDFTISMWLKFYSTGSQMGLYDKWQGGQQEILAQYESDGTNQWFEIDTSPDGSSASGFHADFAPATSTWYNVVYTKSGTVGTIYVNGSPIGIGSLDSGIFASNTALDIGYRNVDSSPFDGLMNDTRVWARALSTSEVSDMYVNPCNTNYTTNLRAWWEFNGDGNDVSGNQNNLAGVNSPEFSTDIPHNVCLIVNPTTSSTIFNTDVGVIGNGSIADSTSTEGVFFGKNISNSSEKISLVGPSSGMTYINFTKPFSDFLGKISFDNALGNMDIISSNNIFFNPATASIFDGKVGVGSTTPSAILSVGSGNSTTVPFAIGSSTTLLSVDSSGHIGINGYKPSLSSCGTSHSLKGDDTAGTITVGSNTNSCTLAFASSRAKAPHCVVSNQSPSISNAMSYTENANKLVINQQALGGSKIDYICLGN
jgi:hypothetical protein